MRLQEKRATHYRKRTTAPVDKAPKLDLWEFLVVENMRLRGAGSSISVIVCKARNNKLPRSRCAANGWMYVLMCVFLSNYLIPCGYIFVWALCRGLNDTSMCVVVEMSICYHVICIEDEKSSAQDPTYTPQTGLHAGAMDSPRDLLCWKCGLKQGVVGWLG